MLLHMGGGPIQCDTKNKMLDPMNAITINGMYTFRRPLLKHTRHDTITKVVNPNIMGPRKTRSLFNACSCSLLSGSRSSVLENVKRRTNNPNNPTRNPIEQYNFMKTLLKFPVFIAVVSVVVFVDIDIFLAAGFVFNREELGRGTSSMFFVLSDIVVFDPPFFVVIRRSRECLSSLLLLLPSPSFFWFSFFNFLLKSGL